MSLVVELLTFVGVGGGVAALLVAAYHAYKAIKIGQTLAHYAKLTAVGLAILGLLSLTPAVDLNLGWLASFLWGLVSGVIG